MILVKLMIIIKDIFFIISLLDYKNKNKKHYHLNMVVLALSIANITILAFGL